MIKLPIFLKKDIIFNNSSSNKYSMNDKINNFYLKLMEETLLSGFHPYSYSSLNYRKKSLVKNIIKYFIHKLINKKDQHLVLKTTLSAKVIENGQYGQYTNAFTMVGRKRLLNIKALIKKIIDNKVEGDLIEAGIWRGGLLIYMRACLFAFSENRKVFGADSFQGLPPIDEIKYPDDKILKSVLQDQAEDNLSISKKNVIENLKKFNFHDSNTILLEGWFENTLKDKRIKKLSLLRIDGDLYKSTYEALDILYHKVSKGGFIIIDDYGLGSQSCKNAVDDFREKNNIKSKIIKIDWTGVYWQKS